MEDPRSLDHVPGSRSNRSPFMPRVSRKLSGFIPFLAIFAIAVVLIVVGITVLDKSRQSQMETEAQQKKASAATSMAKEVTNSVQGQGIITPPMPNRTPDPSKSQDGKKPEGDKKDASHNGGNDGRRMLPPELMTAQSNRLRGFESALRSKTTVTFSIDGMGSSSPRTARSAPEDPTALYNERLAELSGTLPPQSTSAGGSSASGLGGSSGNRRAGVESFNRGNRWELPNTLEAPKSPYMLRAGFVIPAVMISGIMSDIPGQVMAQVSQNVYDTSTGRFLLIPQGTRLVGTYASEVSYGQSRVMMAWQRLVFPDGRTLDIEAMPGASQSGYSGFNDKVDNHYLRIFGSAILLSGVIAGVSLSQDNDNRRSDNQRASDALSEALGQTLGQAMAEMLRKNINIAPTLQIRPGYRFNVMVTKDLTLPGVYQPFEY